MNSITIRPLESSEWSIFKELRLNALRDAPGVFAMSYEDAAARSEDAWRTMIKGPTHQVFGLFDGERLVGITGVFSWKGDASGSTAELVMSFIVPEYRNSGLSRMLFDARLAWVRARPGFTRVIVSHRAGNDVSRRAILRQDFTVTDRAPRDWPDGVTEDEIFYELQV